MIDDLQTKELRIEPVNVTDRYIFDGELISINVRFCDYYRIHLGDDVIEIHDDAVYLGSDNDCEAIIPKQDASGFVLKQVGRYENEYDDFQKALHEADVEALSRFCIANTTTDPTDAVASLLPDFSGCPLLYGKSFRIRLDPTGKVATVEAASPRVFHPPSRETSPGWGLLFFSPLLRGFFECRSRRYWKKHLSW